MTYLLAEQTSTQHLQSKADLCKCDHLELHHIDEEGHGVCKYCSCNEFDPQ
ncbi:MAG TPA: hypothetical protein VJ225_06985 [Nitrososphaeraceae archaeon]|jgi:hypothetical protein|nr:hypothetical protein [Nitrososphaeraceae archaeon]